MIKELRISGMSCRLYVPPGYDDGEERYPVIYVNGEIPIEEIMTILVNKGVRTDFFLLSIKPESWNDDFTPWTAPAFRSGEEAPQGRADAYLSCLTEKIKPHMDMHYRTRPEPEHTALFGYSLGGLTAVYAIYKTDVFGAAASLSGSLWFDGFCEFMEREKPLRTDLRVYFSLGKKESHSKNPRMSRVAACTERAGELLTDCLEEPGRTGHLREPGEGPDLPYGPEMRQKVRFEWNEGGHFHDIAGRFVKAVMWWTRETADVFGKEKAANLRLEDMRE